MKEELSVKINYDIRNLRFPESHPWEHKGVCNLNDATEESYGARPWCRVGNGPYFIDESFPHTQALQILDTCAAACDMAMLEHLLEEAIKERDDARKERNEAASMFAQQDAEIIKLKKMNESIEARLTAKVSRVEEERNELSRAVDRLTDNNQLDYGKCSPDCCSYKNRQRLKEVVAEVARLKAQLPEEETGVRVYPELGVLELPEGHPQEGAVKAVLNYSAGSSNPWHLLEVDGVARAGTYIIEAGITKKGRTEFLTLGKAAAEKAMEEAKEPAKTTYNERRKGAKDRREKD